MKTRWYLTTIYLTPITEFTPKDGGWWVCNIPEYPGACSQARTEKEAIDNAVSAMKELMNDRLLKAVNDAGRAGDTP